MTIKNSGKFIIQKEKLVIYLFVLSVVFADILGNGNLNLLYFFVYDNNEIHTNIFNEYTNTFTGENVLPERKISPKIIKQNGTKNITMSFKKLT